MFCPIRFTLAILVCSISLLPAGCAVNPVTGQQQLMLVSEQDEAQMGRSTDRSVTEQYGAYEDVALQGYLQGIGQTMGRISHRPALDWRFKVMDSPVVNAFAAPGGYIYVTRGLLAAVNNEAELAGILGHEIGHVTARHSASQYSSMMLANLGLGIGQAVLGGYGDLLGPVMKSGAGLLFLKFSRDDERQADALGVEYASRAGYDAARIADFFVTLQRQPGANGQPASRLPEFFSTHPNPENREATVRSLAAGFQARAPGTAHRVNREQLLQHLDGLVYGEDPRKGFRDGSWYCLPHYKVQLPIPEGWALEREGNHLQMKHPQGKALVLVSIAPGSLVDRAVADFLKSSGAAVQQERRLDGGGMTGRQLVSVLGSGQQRAVVVSHFYQRGPDVFAFHGLAGAADYPAMAELVQRPANGFSAITDPARLNPPPKRIAVARVSRSATLEQALSAWKIDRGLWAEIAWLNGRRLGDLLAADERVKLVKLVK